MSLLCGVKSNGAGDLTRIKNMNNSQTIQSGTFKLMNGVSFTTGEAVTLDELKATILQYLGVPNYSSFVGYKTERMVTIDVSNTDDLVCLWDNVIGTNTYRWYNLNILIVIGYNNNQDNFYVAIEKDGKIDDYQFDKKEITWKGYFGFLHHLTNLLEF